MHDSVRVHTYARTGTTCERPVRVCRECLCAAHMACCGCEPGSGCSGRTAYTQHNSNSAVNLETTMHVANITGCVLEMLVTNASVFLQFFPFRPSLFNLFIIIIIIISCGMRAQ